MNQLDNIFLCNRGQAQVVTKLITVSVIFSQPIGIWFEIILGFTSFLFPIQLAILIQDNSTG